MKLARFSATWLPGQQLIWIVLLLSTTSLSTIGCGNSQFEFAPVSGQILLDGKPVSGARVVFMPQANGDKLMVGPYSNGETDDEGRFQLESVEPRPNQGAVVGPHRVVISTRKTHLDPNDRDIEIVDSPETIPRPYTNYRKTPLSFDVPSDGSDEANFELDGKLGKLLNKRRQ